MRKGMTTQAELDAQLKVLKRQAAEDLEALRPVKLTPLTEEKPKICKDCDHVYNDFRSLSRLECWRRRVPDPVRGGTKPIETYCENERSCGWLVARITGQCGKEARFFKEK